MYSVYNCINPLFQASVNTSGDDTCTRNQLLECSPYTDYESRDQTLLYTIRFTLNKGKINATSALVLIILTNNKLILFAPSLNMNRDKTELNECSQAVVTALDGRRE